MTLALGWEGYLGAKEALINIDKVTHVTFPSGGKLGISRAEFIKPLVSSTENRTQNRFFDFIKKKV